MMTQSSAATRRRVQAPPGAPFRMAELSKQTGIPVQTIRFYVAQGLLPAPVKTSKNMGWYSALHVERLLLINRLQRERFLPLKTIRSLVEGSEQIVIDDERIRLVQLQERLDRLSAREGERASEDRQDGNEKAIQPDEVPTLSLRERSALAALQSSFPSDVHKKPDPELARHWVRIRDSAGLSDRDAPEILEHISRTVDRAIAHELEVMGSRYRAMRPDEVEKIVDVIIPSLNQLFGLLHLRRLGQVFADDKASGAPKF